MKEMSWAYVAGFFDGEGCIHRQKAGSKQFPCERMRVSFHQGVNQGERVISEIADFLEARGFHPKVRIESNGRAFVLALYRADEVGRFLTRVYPYLRVKQDQAISAIAFVSAHKSRRVERVRNG